GQYLAMAEMIVAIATIVRAFELESLTDKPELDVGVSLLPGGPLPCRLGRARRQSPSGIDERLPEPPAGQ
ncbi:MAG: cytochrome P450, partial [Actinobacteria bacterium]|nr:cytochrome P450 [Actinomycetota bacterium]